ncbi:Shikimate kinase 2 [Chlamydiales bacterium SCGC AB-751-O23]|jgi:shikimate kinase|nr:Shikimate kinase 2 [Chlamydiales bacterium SCGC AB-751-O23]
MLALVGFRAVGKTHLASYLKENFSLKIFSTDQYIENLCGMPIKQLVSERGWGFFRSLETQALKEALKSSCDLVDTGGGIVELEENRCLLKKLFHTLYLQQSFSVISQRLQKDNQRPDFSIKNEGAFEGLKEIFNKRASLYREVSKKSIDLNKEDLKTVASLVMESRGKGITL